MTNILENFQPGDLLYGKQNVRAALIDAISQTDRFKHLKRPRNTTIDVVNNKIIIPTIEENMLSANHLDELGHLTSLAEQFLIYLQDLQGQPKNLAEILAITKKDNDEDSYLTRYLCQQAINFILHEDNLTGARIHFLLDGIDLKQELAQNNEPYFTSSEIREIARIIEHPNMETKILFYKNGDLLDFNKVKTEFKQVIAELTDTSSLCLDNSPIKKQSRQATKQHETISYSSPPKTPNRPKRAARTLFSGAPKVTELSLSPTQSACDIFCEDLNKLDELTFENISSNINLLNAALNAYTNIPANLDTLYNHTKIKSALIKTIRLFAEFDAELLPQDETVTAAIAEQFTAMSLEEKQNKLLRHNGVEQLDANTYLQPIRNLLKLHEITTPENITRDLIENIVAKLTVIFDQVFNTNKTTQATKLPASSFLSFMTTTPPQFPTAFNAATMFTVPTP